MAKKISVTVSEVLPKIFHFIFSDRYLLISTFLRIQEFYESPIKKIRGNKFTVEEFMDAYAEYKGNFSYFQDWAGFNVPGNIFINFFNVYHNDIREKETKLFDLLKANNFNFDNDKFYVIGTTSHSSLNHEIAQNHEIAHALYYLNPDYKKEMNLLLEKLGKRNPRLIDQAVKTLSKSGYRKNVFKDELQAFFSTEPKIHLIRRGFVDRGVEIPKDFAQCFNTFKKITSEKGVIQ
jgi:hypothetical protein